jgi:hypothetical protein
MVLALAVSAILAIAVNFATNLITLDRADSLASTVGLLVGLGSLAFSTFAWTLSKKTGPEARSPNKRPTDTNGTNDQPGENGVEESR